MARRWGMVRGGFTHSRAAREAEERGEFPMSRAVEVVYSALECRQHKISRRKVREFLEKNCGRGWHHVAGPNGVREVAYYATMLTDDQKHHLLGTKSVESGLSAIPAETAATVDLLHATDDGRPE